MKKTISKALLLLMLTVSISYAGIATLEKAQHRLPPVIYSLEIPKTIIADQDYNFEWSVMGYHDSYDVIITIYNSNGKKIINKNVSPHSTTTGAYSWGEIQSKKFSYSVNLNLGFTTSQDLIVRFFAKPLNDSIDDETFLSLLVPGGLGYEAGDTTGRKIKIQGVSSMVWNDYSETLSDGSTIYIEKTFANDKNGNETYRLTLEHSDTWTGLHNATLMLSHKDYGLEVDSDAIMVRGYYNTGGRAEPFDSTSTEAQCNTAVLKFIGSTATGAANAVAGVVVGGLGLYPACFGKTESNIINDPAYYDLSNYDVTTIASEFNTGVKKIEFNFSFGKKSGEEWNQDAAKLHFYLPYKRIHDDHQYYFHKIIDMPIF